MKRFEILILCLLLSMAKVRAQTLSRPGTTNGPAARVIIVEDTLATADLVPVPEKIQLMVHRAITNLTGKTSVPAAWNSLLSTNDTVGLKVLSGPGENSGTRPTVVAAIVQDLIASGMPPHKIIVWDKHASDLRLAGFYEFEPRYGIRVVGAIQEGFDTNKFYESPLLGALIWSDVEFGKSGAGVGRKSYLSKVLTREITKIINITPLLHHNLLGVSGNLYGLALGSVDNTGRFEKEESSLARAVPEIYALPLVGDRVVLNVVDALICQYEGQQSGLLHYSTVLNELRFSRDPVALDVLSVNEINRERALAGALPCTNLDLYENASLVEIGVNNLKRIQVDKMPSPQPLPPGVRPGEKPPPPSK